MDLINWEDLRSEEFVIDWMWYYERGSMSPRFLMGSSSTETENIVSVLSLQVSKRKMVHLSSPLELGGSLGYLSRSAGHIVSI